MHVPDDHWAKNPAKRRLVAVSGVVFSLASGLILVATGLMSLTVYALSMPIVAISVVMVVLRASNKIVAGEGHEAIDTMSLALAAVGVAAIPLAHVFVGAFEPVVIVGLAAGLALGFLTFWMARTGRNVNLVLVPAAAVLGAAAGGAVYPLANIMFSIGLDDPTLGGLLMFTLFASFFIYGMLSSVVPSTKSFKDGAVEFVQGCVGVVALTALLDVLIWMSIFDR